MATNPKETVLDWLRDAHAMENALVTLLDKQVNQLKDRPDMQGKIREHLEATRNHRERIKDLVEKHGGDVSAVKDATGKLVTSVQAMMSGMAPDAVVKNSLGNFAVENFEIACYRSLIAAAEAQGMTDVATTCRGILDEEREMASWLEHHIPRITTEYLGRQATAR